MYIFVLITTLMNVFFFTVKLYSDEAVSLNDFKIIRVLGTGGKYKFYWLLYFIQFNYWLFFNIIPKAYGRVFLVRKLTRHDAGKLYAMKVLNKITVVQKRKTAEHTKTERVVSGEFKYVQGSIIILIYNFYYLFYKSGKIENICFNKY